jgi:SRSO17 transposase
MTLPILEIPSEVSKHCQPYQTLFSKPQFKQFERFITSLLISDEANLESLSEGLRLSQSYDSLHHFVSESDWDINNVLEQTVSVIKNLPEDRFFHDKGILIIDDTLIEKYGKLMEATGKLWDHSENRYLKYAHCLLGLCRSDNKGLRYPLRFELYRKEEDCERDGIEFKTKIRLAIELIDWAISQGVDFQTVVFDSWFFCKELADHIEGLGKDWISMSKTNRKMAVQGEEQSCGDYGETLDPNRLPIVKVKEKEYAIKSVQVGMPSLKREKRTIRLAVSFEKDAETGEFKRPVFLVSNRKDIRPERLIRAYQIRWNIETFFKDAKSQLGLGEYQMRGLNGIKSHWCLVFTSAVLLELVRWDACTKEGIDISNLTFGDLKRRAFGQTMKTIIQRVIDCNKSGMDAEEICRFLKI